MLITEEVYLEHHGIKGMHWGLRKSKDKSPSGQKSDHKKTKTVAIVLGSAVGIAAIALGAKYVSSRSGIKLSDIGSVKAAAESVSHEPTDILHSSRGKHKGYKIFLNGGLKNPTDEFIKAGANERNRVDTIHHYGDRLEKIYSALSDPAGRKDQSGRPIIHDVVIPEHLAKHITHIDQIKKLVFPRIKDAHDAYYNMPG